MNINFNQDLKNTPDDHTDRDNLLACIAILIIFVLGITL